MFHYPQLASSDALLLRDTAYDTSPLVADWRSDLYLDLGRVNESQRWAHEALAVEGETPRVLERMALVYVLNGNPDAGANVRARPRKSPVSGGARPAVPGGARPGSRHAVRPAGRAHPAADAAQGLCRRLEHRAGPAAVPRRQSVEPDGVRVPARALPAHLRHEGLRRAGSPAEGLLSRSADARSGSAARLPERERGPAAGHRRIGDRPWDRLQVSRTSSRSSRGIRTALPKSAGRLLHPISARRGGSSTSSAAPPPGRPLRSVSTHREERQVHNEVTVREPLPLCGGSHPAGSVFVLSACQSQLAGTPRSASRRHPVLYPDYAGTVIPPNIAPLNFVVKEPGVRFLARADG